MNLIQAHKACQALLGALAEACIQENKSEPIEQDALTTKVEDLQKELGYPFVKVGFRTADGQSHSYSLEAAAQTLQEYLEEWPGGLSEIQSALRTSQLKTGEI